MIQVPSAGWRLLACPNGAFPEWIVVVGLVSGVAVGRWLLAVGVFVSLKVRSRCGESEARRQGCDSKAHGSAKKCNLRKMLKKHMTGTNEK